jgi:hypothetical protein
MNILFLVEHYHEKCSRNAANRSEMKANHTTSTWSFINILHKKVRSLKYMFDQSYFSLLPLIICLMCRKKITGAKPGALEFYSDTHKKKDGSFVKEVVENFYVSK